MPCAWYLWHWNGCIIAILISFVNISCSIIECVVFFYVIGIKILSVKSADASSAHSNYPPSQAIDNDKDTMFHSDNTIDKTNPWLQIELEYVATVHQAIIINRKDCCGNSMKNVALRVGLIKFTKGMDLKDDEICAKYQGPGTNGEKIEIKCSSPMKGQYVSIHLIEHTPAKINLMEIIIYGNPGK